MNIIKEHQKIFIVSSAVASAALTQTSSQSEMNHDFFKSATEKNQVQLSSLHLTKSEVRLEKKLNFSNHLRLIKAEQVNQKDDQEESLEKVESPWPSGTILSLGDQGDKVKKIQKLLHEIGYYLAEKDGLYGEKTKDSVLRYQEKYGLKIDGIVGEETITHLVGIKTKAENTKNNHFTVQAESDIPQVYQANIKERSSSSSVFINSQDKQQEESLNYLKYGDENQQVLTLQKKLKKASYYQGTTDGIFGSYTQQAVRQLQRDQSLSIDGLAGKEVMTFLKEKDLTKIANERQQQTSVTTANDTRVSSSVNHSPSNSRLFDKAKNYLGTPYSWGGTTPAGFDCSGFLVHVFQQVGVELPRTVAEIWHATSPTSSRTPGDIVFFETYKKGPSHAGIYLGSGKFIQAGSSTGVTISSFSNSYWNSRYIGVRSVK